MNSYDKPTCLCKLLSPKMLKPEQSKPSFSKMRSFWFYNVISYYLVSPPLFSGFCKNVFVGLTALMRDIGPSYSLKRLFMNSNFAVSLAGDWNKVFFEKQKGWKYHKLLREKSFSWTEAEKWVLVFYWVANWSQDWESPRRR